MTTAQAKLKFGKYLRDLRRTRGLTYRALGAQTRVDFAIIGQIERGQRATGPKVAEALATGLCLQGAQRHDFVARALATTERDRIPIEARQLPPEFFYRLWQWLDAHDINASSIKSVKREPDRGWDLLIEMRNGDAYGLEFKLTKKK
jgi:transcriptional regulator with XRE-family HTH domain